MPVNNIDQDVSVEKQEEEHDLDIDDTDKNELWKEKLNEELGEK